MIPPLLQIGDPRLGLPQEAGEDIRPVVARQRGSTPRWLVIAAVLAAGLVLFLMLDARRRALNDASATASAGRGVILPAPPPPLIIPPAPLPVPAAPSPVVPPVSTPPVPVPRPSPPNVVYVPQAPRVPAEPPAPPLALSGAALVVDTGAAARTGSGSSSAAAGGTAVTPSIMNPRIQAGTLANRATTVPQGTLVPAVLESALDSTRPGLARAIVSRDVRGFDGTRILIPRGSRLVGIYSADVQRGENRALVNWMQLTRPDGVTIAISSPSADPLGRAGTAARVNSHFFERFGGVILQSALNLGLVLASSEIGGGTLVVVPGTLQGAAQVTQPQQIPPTLTVRQGTSISVFVARDLDFTGVDAQR